MFKILRMICSVIAAAGAAVAIFIFAYFRLWGLLPVGLCVAFAALTFLFKHLQEKEELKKNPPPPEGDFITGKVKNGGNISPGSGNAQDEGKE